MAGVAGKGAACQQGKETKRQLIKCLQNLSPIKNTLKGHKLQHHANSPTHTPPSHSNMHPFALPTPLCMLRVRAAVAVAVDNRWQSMFALHYYYWNKWIKYREKPPHAVTMAWTHAPPSPPAGGFIYAAPPVQGNCQRVAATVKIGIKNREIGNKIEARGSAPTEYGYTRCGLSKRSQIVPHSLGCLSLSLSLSPCPPPCHSSTSSFCCSTSNHILLAQWFDNS